MGSLRQIREAMQAAVDAVLAQLGGELPAGAEVRYLADGDFVITGDTKTAPPLVRWVGPEGVWVAEIRRSSAAWFDGSVGRPWMSASHCNDECPLGLRCTKTAWHDGPHRSAYARPAMERA